MKKLAGIVLLFAAAAAYAAPPYDGGPGDGAAMAAAVYTQPDTGNNVVYNGGPCTVFARQVFSAKRPVLTFINVPTDTAVGGDAAMTVRLYDGEGVWMSAPDNITINLVSSSSNSRFGMPWNSTSVILPSGANSVDIHYQDYVAGNPTITAIAPDFSVKSAQTTIGIAPAAADHFTVVPQAGGIKVNEPGLITVTARDPYNNIDTAYTGRVVFTSTGSMTITPISHLFATADQGVYAFQITDPKVETLRLTATRDTITGVSDECPVNGPYVLSATSLTGSALLQGCTEMPLLRFQVKTSSSTAEMTKLWINRTGTCADSDFARLLVYRDNGNHSFTAAEDVLIGSGTFKGSGDVTITISSQTISTTVQSYFIACDLSPTAAEGATAGIALQNQASFMISGGTYSFIGSNNLPVIASTAAIMAAPHALIVASSDIAHVGIIQGETNAPLLKLTAVSSQGNVYWNSLRLDKRGTSVNDITRVTLWCNDIGSGVFDPSLDRIVSSGSFVSGSARLEGARGFNETINTSTKTYFVTADASLSATPGASFGVECADSGYFGVNGWNTVSLSNTVRSSTAAIIPTTDILTATQITTDPSVGPAEVLQGTHTVKMMKLSLSVNQNETLWSALRLDRTGTAGDGDITAVKVLAEDGTLISRGDDVFAEGVVTVTLPQEEHIRAGESKIYFIAADIAPEATLGATVGLRIGSAAGFTISAPDTVVAAGYPKDSPVATITEFPDTVVIISSSSAPTKADPGATVAMEKLEVFTGQSSALWSSVTIRRVGSGAQPLPDADISAVKIYKDNGKKSFDASATFLSSAAFQAGEAVIALDPPQVITASTQTFYAVVVLSTSAAPNGAFYLRFPGGFAVNAPNSLGSGCLPVNSGVTTVAQPPVTVQARGESMAPGSVDQGTLFVPMLKLFLNTTQYSAAWNHLRLNLSGTAADIARIRVFKDKNGDGVFTQTTDDVQINGNTDRFDADTGIADFDLTLPQTILTQGATYFVVLDVSDTSNPGDTVAVSLLSNGITVDWPNLVGIVPAVSSPATINAVVNTVTVIPADNGQTTVQQASTGKVLETLTVQSDNLQVAWSKLKLTLTGTGSFADIKNNLKIYRDDNNNNLLDSGETLISGQAALEDGQVAVPMITPELITKSLKKYFIVADISQTATVGATVGIECWSSTGIVVNAPNLVVSTPNHWACTQPAVTDQPDTLLASAVNIAGATVDQGQTNAAFLRLGLRTNHDRAVLTSVKVFKLDGSTLADAKLGDIKIYDETDMSQTIGHAALVGGQVTINIIPQTIVSATHYYLIAADIGQNADVGALIGLQVKDSAGLTVTAPDTASLGQPLSSALATVRDIRTPTKPVVTAEGSFTSHFQQLNATWQSSVIGGTVTDSQYAVGTSTGAVDVRGWTSNGPSTQVAAQGLSLQNGRTYYISVKTKSNFGFWSDPGTSGGITVDLVAPAINGTPTVSTDGDTYMVSWPEADAGLSGVKIYELQERIGSSPVWRTVAVSTAAAAAPGRVTARRAPGAGQTSYIFTGRTAGTYYYRVRALNGTDTWSDFSPVVRVIYGTLPGDVISGVSVYPNPFESKNTKATITYTLNRNTGIKIKIYDLFGHYVNELSFNGGAAGGMAGANDMTWDGTDKGGAKVSMGGYIAILTADTDAPGNKVIIKIGVVH